MHRELFRYNRLPFGSGFSPSHIPKNNGQLAPGDPSLPGEDDQDHLHNLETVLQRLEEAGLRLKLAKCEFVTPEVTYLGHRINKEGLQPIVDKVRAVREFPNPGSVAKLKSFLGMLASFSLICIYTTLHLFHIFLARPRKVCAWSQCG